MNKAKRIYELFPSQNRFFLQGLFITGPKQDSPITISLYSILLSVLVLYSFFLCRTMLDASLILCIGFYITYATTIMFMLLTNMTDPALIPSRPFLQLQQQQIQRQHNYNYTQLLTLSKYQRLIYLLYQTSDPSQIFCCSCHIYRPISASHCRRCDSCYLAIDHHCPWLGTCVAKNNYWTFLAFLGSIIGLMLVLGVNGLVFVDYLSNQENGEGGNRQQAKDKDNWTVYIVVCCVIVGGLLLVVVGFLVFHIVLVCKGKTTRQFIKEKRNNNNRDKPTTVVEQGTNHQQKQQQQSLSQSLISSTTPQTQHINITTTQNQPKTIPQILASSKISQRFLDSYIQSIYRQANSFYEQLFNTRGSIRLIDFRHQLSDDEENIIVKGLVEIQQKNKAMKEQGASFQYFKHVLVT